MKSSRIAILALIFLPLGIYVYFFEMDRKEASVAGPDEIVKLIDVKPEEVVEIVLTRKDQRIVFQRENDQWKIKAPMEANANPGRVTDLLAVFDYGIIREITSQPTAQEMTEYGLDQPEIQMEIKFRGNLPPQILMLGAESPNWGSCYGMLKGQGRVVLLGIRYKEDLKRDLNYYIS